MPVTGMNALHSPHYVGSTTLRLRLFSASYRRELRVHAEASLARPRLGNSRAGAHVQACQSPDPWLLLCREQGASPRFPSTKQPPGWSH